MKTKDVLTIGAIGVLAYAVLQKSGETVKETTPVSVGMPAFSPTISLAPGQGIGDLAGLLAGIIPALKEKAEGAAGSVFNITIPNPGGGFDPTNPDIWNPTTPPAEGSGAWPFDFNLPTGEGGGPGLPDVPKISLVDKLLGAWGQYTKDFERGAGAGIDFFSWLTGGWQENNKLVAALQRSFFTDYDFVKPKDEPWELVPKGSLTDISKYILTTGKPWRPFAGGEKTQPGAMNNQEAYFDKNAYINAQATPTTPAGEPPYQETLQEATARTYQGMMVPKGLQDYKSEGPTDAGGGLKRWGTSKGIPVISKLPPGTYGTGEWN